MVYSLISLLELVRFLATSMPSNAPITCAVIKSSIEAGAIPVIDLVRVRPIVIAGLAKEVLEVSRMAPKIHSGT
jgi:hypothetical protein